MEYYIGKQKIIELINNENGRNWKYIVGLINENSKKDDKIYGVYEKLEDIAENVVGLCPTGINNIRFKTDSEFGIEISYRPKQKLFVQYDTLSEEEFETLALAILNKSSERLGN